MPLAKARPEGGKTSNIKLPETGLATASPAAKKANMDILLRIPKCYISVDEL